MYEDVSVGVILTAERAFDVATRRTLLIPTSSAQAAKESSSGECIRPLRARRRAQTSPPSKRTAAQVVRSVFARGAAVSYTHPQSLRLTLVPRHARGRQKSSAPHRIAARKGCSQQ